MYKSSENETFDGYNIPVALAAKIMGKDQQYMEILQIARNTFYKYKREPLAETEDAGSTVE